MLQPSLQVLVYTAFRDVHCLGFILYAIGSVVFFSRRYRYWTTLHLGMYTVWDLYCLQYVVVYASVFAIGIGLHCTSGCTLFAIECDICCSRE